MQRETVNIDKLLREAQCGDAASLDALETALKPGLELLVRRSLPSATAEIREAVLTRTLAEFRTASSQIRHSATGFARTILSNHILNELLRMAQGGDRAALSDLFVQLRVRIADDPQFSKQGWGAEIDDDLLQDVCVTFLNKFREDVRDNPYAYFRQIVTFKIRDRINARKRRLERFDDSRTTHTEPVESDESSSPPFDLPSSEDVALRVEENDLLEHIIMAIEELPEFCRKFFKALYRQESEKMLRNKVRREWNLGESALNTRIHRCRHSLKELLAKKEVL
jgi:DNA-directed RNA polymerase specialized sigma24 family protein